jgi:hypothetical protein
MKIAVAYSDTASLVKAIQFCDRIVQEYWEQFEIECTWWKFGFLQHPEIFRRAVAAAADADLILLSVPAHNKLPEDVEDWVDEWLERRGCRPGALVSLIPSETREDGPRVALEGYFHEVAQRGFMDYFPHHLGTLGNSEENDEEPGLSARILDALPEDASTPRWGINE